MNKPAEQNVTKAVDSIQSRITDFATDLKYESLPADAIHAAKVRIIDTFGALIGGFSGEPCRIARKRAAQTLHPDGATIIGTKMKTIPEMAAFTNATTARYPEINDLYLQGVAHGHPSDTIMPVLAIAEPAAVNGKDFITAVIVSYEVFVRISDVYQNREAFDTTNFAAIGTAAAASKLLGLSAGQLAHSISMAAVPNIILKQVRRNHKTMFKAVSAGQAGRAGVFAALLAQDGMEGPHLPFEGKSGWCAHVALERFSLNTWGGKDVPFKVMETRIKARPCEGGNIACILAAEKVVPLKSISGVKHVVVEVHSRGREHFMAFEQHFRNPENKEAADHSIPFVVAATLMDGTVSLRSYDQAHLTNRELHALMQKIEVAENDKFTEAYARTPREHHTRVTVTMGNGEKLVGEHRDDVSTPPSDIQITDKFRGLTGDVLNASQTSAILDRLWHLEDLKNIAEIPPAFAFQ